MHSLLTMTVGQPAKREREIREAVLLTFCDAPLRNQGILENLSAREWRRLLIWLDTSGLALYFLDRLIELDQTGAVPNDVIGHLRQKLADNIARTNGMFAELAKICAAFDAAAVPYAVLKGCSLWPDSVAQLELRSQLDLDFLVAAESASIARRILEDHGYYLRAICGDSWEFKMNVLPGWSLKQLYKNGLSRSAELHIANGDRRPLLERAENRCIREVEIPVLCPTDLIIGQGVHVFKHVCGEFSRTAHLLEFRRHVIRRYDDVDFWNEVRLRSQHDPRVRVALGVVTLLITHAMGCFAPAALTQWTVDRLPVRARLWIEHYGKEIVFVNFPGSKLYLLLQRELVSSGLPEKKALRRALLPLSWPPQIVYAQDNEMLLARMRRYCVQTRFILFRLKFHVLASLQYLIESTRWRLHTNGLVS